MTIEVFLCNFHLLPHTITAVSSERGKQRTTSALANGSCGDWFKMVDCPSFRMEKERPSSLTSVISTPISNGINILASIYSPARIVGGGILRWHVLEELEACTSGKTAQFGGSNITAMEDRSVNRPAQKTSA
jgi:hypothetical protein